MKLYKRRFIFTNTFSQTEQLNSLLEYVVTVNTGLDNYWKCSRYEYHLRPLPNNNTNCCPLIVIIYQVHTYHCNKTLNNKNDNIIVVKWKKLYYLLPP